MPWNKRPSIFWKDPAQELSRPLRGCYIDASYRRNAVVSSFPGIPLGPLARNDTIIKSKLKLLTFPYCHADPGP